jgi:hypothetical protein
MVKSEKLPASTMARNSKLFFQHDTLLILPVTFMIHTVCISSKLSHFFIQHDRIFYKISLFLKPNYTFTWNTQTPYCTQMYSIDGKRFNAAARLIIKKKKIQFTYVHSKFN